MKKIVTVTGVISVSCFAEIEVDKNASNDEILEIANDIASMEGVLYENNMSNFKNANINQFFMSNDGIPQNLKVEEE